MSNAVALTGNPYVDGLLQGSAWQFSGGSRVLTYSLSLNDTGVGGSWIGNPLADAVRRALAEFSNVANVAFVESGSGTVFTASTADIAITLTGNELSSQVGAVGLGIFPSPEFADQLLSDSYTRSEYPRPEGDVFLDDYHSGFSIYSLRYMSLILHELGHALGLKHPSDDGANGRPTFAELGIAGSDTWEQTVMSESMAPWGGRRRGPCCST